MKRYQYSDREYLRILEVRENVGPTLRNITDKNIYEMFVLTNYIDRADPAILIARLLAVKYILRAIQGEAATARVIKCSYLTGLTEEIEALLIALRNGDLTGGNHGNA